MRYHLIFTAFLSVVCSIAYASSIEISPVRLQLAAGQKITSFEVRNLSEHPLVIQLHVKKWRHDHGKDLFEDTKEVLITPPLTKLDPQDVQVVRVGLLTPPNPKNGETYRVFLQEVPQKPLVAQFGVQTLLEIRVPLLVAPLIYEKPCVSWKVSCVNPQSIKINLLNTGNSHFQISKFILKKEGATEPLIEKDIFDYLLPAQTKEWILDIPEPFTGGPLQVSAITNQGEVTEVLTPSP